jgi:hypothetical protein
VSKFILVVHLFYKEVPKFILIVDTFYKEVARFTHDTYRYLSKGHKKAWIVTRYSENSVQVYIYPACIVNYPVPP